MSSPSATVVIKPVERGDLDSVRELAARHDILRSRDWFERCLYACEIDPADEPGGRGFVALNELGHAVCVQLHHPVYLYSGRQRILAFQREILAADGEYGSYVFDVIGACEDEEGRRIVLNNCLANKKALKVANLSGLKPGPEGCGLEMNLIVDTWSYVIYAVLSRGERWCPLILRSLLQGMRFWRRLTLCFRFQVRGMSTLHSFRDQAYKHFWECYLDQNVGVVSDRSPAVMEKLFGCSISRGDVAVLCCRDSDGAILGHVVLRRYEMVQGVVKYEIADLIALGDNEEILLRLLAAARDFVYRNMGVRLGLMTGCLKLRKIAASVLPRTKTLAVPAFVFKASKEDERLLMDDKNWFWGPFDGERCLGHGAYIE